MKPTRGLRYEPETPSTGAVLLVWGIGLLLGIGFWVLVVTVLIKYVF